MLKSSVFSLIFDGMSRVGEAVGVVARAVTQDFKIFQKLISLKTLARSADGEVLRKVLEMSVTEYVGVGVKDIVGLVHDSAPVNNKAVEGFAYSKLIVNLPCLSHILSNCGKKMDIDVLNNFMKLWNSLFAHSFKQRRLGPLKLGPETQLPATRGGGRSGAKSLTSTSIGAMSGRSLCSLMALKRQWLR